jgi:transcriptional regulator of arginine metabolism
MISKKMRQGRVLEIIRHQAVYSQQELMSALRQSGIRVTQATLSRDIHELGLVKGVHGYQVEEGGDAASSEEQLRRVLREFLMHMDYSGNLIVLKTNPGCAHIVAVALDRIGWDEIIGTVAGDDTIFVATARGSNAASVMHHIGQVVGWE